MLTPEDFKTHLYGNAIDAISDNDEDLLTDAIATAYAEAAGYLSRFDTDTIFENDTIETKYANLVTWLKDIAKWHFINICNVSVDLVLAESRYKIAIAELGKIQKGLIVPKGWPLADTDTPDFSGFYIASSPKRGNYF
jgi:hypothetical protein